MTKSELRKKYLDKRKNLSNNEVLKLSDMIFRNFISQFEVKEGQKVHVFMSISKFNEVNTGFFFRHFLNNGVRIFLPKMVGDKIIAVEFTKNTEMAQNSWGIAEPVSSTDRGVKDFDYVITPLVYCDPSGERVGYGKGYYDGFFTTIDDRCLKVGVSFFSPQETIDDLTESDVRLDYLVTPTEILSFRGF
jgi:5-formyltetrahydrofolate cyclo-ligase